MQRTFLQFLYAVRASYWFLPSVMLVAAMALGAVTVWLDTGPAANLFEGVSWYQRSKPDGARAVLSTIAGSMITVAGVVFSITIVAISYAASQYGPRILTNFMSDRGNQVTLGTFIATFAYSIVVLRTIYSGETAFVPQLAVFVALLLAFCSIVVLIYFVHHTPASMHVNSVVARIGRQLIHLIKKQFPSCIGQSSDNRPEGEAALERTFEQRFAHRDRVVRIEATADGYLQAVDSEELMEAATKHDLVVCLERSPGQFVYHGGAIASAWAADRITDRARSDVRECFSVGTKRTPFQDELFLVDELVEIAARALSPSVNDPYTAMTCVDWLSAATAELSRRQPPSRFRVDDQGRLRLVAPDMSFEQQIRRGFGRMRPYLATDINAAAHALRTFARLAEDCRSPRHIEAIAEEAHALCRQAQDNFEGPSLEQLHQQMEESKPAIEEALKNCRIDSARDPSGSGADPLRDAAE